MKKTIKVMRSHEEIDAQIEGLKKMKGKLPEVSFFGGNNWEVIDTQILVLKGEVDIDEYYNDEHSEDFTDGDNELYFEAERAVRWLEGDEREDLFENE